MTPDELLRLYPRETLRWWRDRLALDRDAFANHVGITAKLAQSWGSGRHGITPDKRARLSALLAPHLATPEGEAFVRSPGHGEASEERKEGGEPDAP